MCKCAKTRLNEAHLYPPKYKTLIECLYTHSLFFWTKDSIVWQSWNARQSWNLTCSISMLDRVRVETETAKIEGCTCCEGCWLYTLLNLGRAETKEQNWTISLNCKYYVYLKSGKRSHPSRQYSLLSVLGLNRQMQTRRNTSPPAMPQWLKTRQTRNQLNSTNTVECDECGYDPPMPCLWFECKIILQCHNDSRQDRHAMSSTRQTPLNATSADTIHPYHVYGLSAK